MKATSVDPAATHMKAYISVPMFAPMLICVCERAAFRKMTKMTVPRTAATVVRSAARNVKITTGIDASLENMARGATKMLTKERQAPLRKSPNIHCEAMRRVFKISATSLGNATIMAR
jgi:hypothetical protein